jgi:hypothetical protein
VPSSLTEIRAALGETMAQNGLSIYPTLEDVVQTPAAVVMPSIKNTIVFTGSMAMGGDKYSFDVLVLMAATNVENAQRIIDGYITGQGPTSLREFIFRNSGLGLPDVDAMVDSVQGYNGKPTVAGIQMIGAIVRVYVTVT